VAGEIRLQWWREAVLGERVGEAAANPVALALRETQLRYDLASQSLVNVIEAHRFDIYNAPISSIDDFQSYAVRTVGAIFELAVGILADHKVTATPKLVIEAGVAQTIAGVLARLPLHAVRRQLYIPLEILGQYRAEPDDIFAMRATPEVRAALADLRLRCRRQLAHIGTAEVSPTVQPAFLSIAPLWQWLRDMERLDYDPFRPPQVAPWRRQWRIWRAAISFRRVGG